MQQGAAYVELLTVLSMLLFVGLCCLELSNMLRVHQVVSVISREASNLALRKCANLEDAATLQNCLEYVHGDVLEHAQSALQLSNQDLLNNFALVITLAKYPVGCSDSSCVIGVNYPPGGVFNAPNIQGQTRISTSDFVDSAGDHYQLLELNRCVTASEVFLGYRPLTPFAANLLEGVSNGLGDRLLYDITFF